MPVRRGTQQVKLWRRTAAGILVPFAGPADSPQTFLVWGSPARGYSAAVAATGTQKAFRVCSAGPDVNGTDILVTTTGLTNVAALNSWIASFGTAHVNTLYDQTGGGKDWVQTTFSKMPTIVVNGINGLPSLVFAAASSQTMTTSGTFTQTPAYTAEAVAMLTSAAASQILSASNADIELNFQGASNQVGLFAFSSGATGIAASAANNAPHVIQGTWNSSTTSTLNVDGATQVTGNSGLLNLGTSALVLGSFQDSTQYLTGQVSEVGVYTGTYNSAVQTNTRTAYGL